MNQLPPNLLERLSPAEEQMKNKSINSWLHYQANKIDGGLRHLTHANKSTKDPFTILLEKLSGLGSNLPKCLVPWECFGKDLLKKLVNDFDNDFQKSGKSTNLQAKLWNEFLQVEFNKLQPLEKKAWVKWAQDMHGAQVEEAEICSSKLMNLPPEDRQDCLDHISDFFYSILDGVHELLNMHVTILIGGPELKKSGQLNVLRLIGSLNIETNLSPISKTWGEADEEKYQLVTQNFKEFLCTAYNPRAWPEKEAVQKKLDQQQSKK
ncbi:hypothetical protein BDN71DRAFT_1427538 [Pleurotus eryngii]|uniref:Uncharacterized protein n=1 Tax=Pleurotus eryngii TaxID=5323 RepID=A0A9P6A717_PLEER|nr:hypothetical protein BDN71DRAFT_1427538 [Pleurotus eryngii]